MNSTTIGSALFTKTQQRVLGLLYSGRGKRLYTNEIVRLADMGRGTVRRELEKLVSAGLLLVTQEGNQRYYQANSGCPVYEELLSIVKKTFGITDVIREALVPLHGQIDLAFIYGSIAKKEETASSDIDLLVVTDSLAYSDLMTVLSEVEPTLGRPVNPSIYTAVQIKERLQQQNAFLTRVMEQPKLWVKGSDDDIRKFRERPISEITMNDDDKLEIAEQW